MHTVKIVAVLAAVLLIAAPAAALERGGFTLEVLVDGRPLAEHAARGNTYVEAIEGGEYSLRFHNPTARRVAVALAVDGLNTIDARTTTASRASRWIVAPHGTLTIEGWQVGADTARRFFFTTEDDSYGAWLGKTRNLGVITAVVFRERVVEYSKSMPAERESSGRRDAPSRKAESPSAGASDDLAATGIGRKVDHRVRRVSFDAEDRPAATLEFRYEYRGALVDLGVLPDHRALSRRERARGFAPERWAPDPYMDSR